MGLRLIKIWWELNVLMLLNIYGSVKQKKIIDKPKNNRQFAHNTISSGALICKILFTIIFLSQINFSWSSAHNPLRPDMVWCYSGDHVWLSTWLLCELQVIRRDIFRGTQTPGEIKTYTTEIHDHIQLPLSSFSPCYRKSLQSNPKCGKWTYLTTIKTAEKFPLIRCHNRSLDVMVRIHTLDRLKHMKFHCNETHQSVTFGLKKTKQRNEKSIEKIQVREITAKN